MMAARWAGMLQDRQRLGDALAVAAFAVYVAGMFLFGYTMLSICDSVIAEMHRNRVFAVLSMAFAVAAIAMRRRALSSGQIALFAVGGVGLERLCAINSLMLLAMIAVAVALSVSGLAYNKDAIDSSSLVFSYGFRHPNMCGSFLFTCCAGMAYACWNRRSWWVPLVLSAASAAFSYVFLCSRAAAVTLAVLAFAIAVGRVTRRRGGGLLPGRVFFASLTALPFLMLLLMAVSTVFYSADDPVFAFVDMLLGGRPRFAHQYYLEQGGFALFGAKYTVIPHYHNGQPFSGVDFGYCTLMLTTGVFALAAMAATYVAAVRRLSRENPHFLIMAILLLCAAYLMFEGYQLYLVSGVMAIFVSRAFAGEGSAPD